MGRQVSWEPRLHEIRRSVANSVRSHYDRNDLQQLFKVQPRSAGKLLEMLPTVPVGRSRLVEREALARFMEGAHAADDLAAYCAQQRALRKVKSRRKLRSMVRRDNDKIEAASLAQWMKRGELNIRYNSVDELFDVLMRIACSLQDDLDSFIELYEIAPPPENDDESVQELRAMFAELRRMEAVKRMPIRDSNPPPNGHHEIYPSN